MPNSKQIIEALNDSTRFRILELLAQGSFTNTEIFHKLNDIKYRESVFKALKRLQKAGLVGREFDEQLGGYRYFIKFKKIEIDRFLKAKLI